MSGSNHSLDNKPLTSTEPSMDEILSSIRRILKDDEPMRMAPAADEPDAPADSVLILDASMMVPDEAAPARDAHGHAREHEALASSPTMSSATPAGSAGNDRIFEPAPEPSAFATTGSVSPGATETASPILGARTAEAASAQFGALMRSLPAERPTATTAGRGVTVEDMVREAIRPMLKSWLDTNLPGLVERMVRAEIERLVGPGQH